MSQSTLMAHVDAHVVTRENLADIVTPPAMGSRHAPIPHGDLLSCLSDAVGDHGFRITREQLAVGGSVMIENEQYTDTNIFGALDLARADTAIGPMHQPFDPDGEMGISIGFRSSNAQRFGLRVVGGQRVFVCDNMALTGNPYGYNRKHTTGLDIREIVADILGSVLADTRRHRELIDAFRTFRVSENAARDFLYMLFVDKRILPINLMRKVHNTYFERHDEYPEIDAYHGRAWGLHNALTRAIRGKPLHTEMRLSESIATPFRVLVGAN